MFGFGKKKDATLPEPQKTPPAPEVPASATVTYSLVPQADIARIQQDLRKATNLLNRVIWDCEATEKSQAVLEEAKAFITRYDR